MQPKRRASWYDPAAALGHAGGLKDTLAGRKKYLEYLAWLAEDEPARKKQRFDQMSKGWVIGTTDFVRDVAEEHRELSGLGRHLQRDLQAVREAEWQELLARLLRLLGRRVEELSGAGKSEPWKLALAAVLKSRTTATNRWLGTTLHLGNLHEVSRKVAAWLRWTPNPKI